MILNKKITILITGGTGSFGKEAVKYFVKKKNIKKVIVFSRDELKQSDMKNIIHSKKIRYFIGDVRDKGRLSIATRNVDYIIHAAALKQVDTAEYNPTEFIETNIMGAKNLIEICSVNKIKKIIALSTDKACSPINLYGATKLCSDKLFISANNYLPDTSFSIVRYGNVEGSRGSVIPIFKKMLSANFLPITSKNMTRFSLPLQESVKLVDWALSNSYGGEIIIPKISSYKILDLVKAFGLSKKIKVIGIRPGEKLFEELISIHDSLNTYELKRYYVILPPKNKKIIKFYKKKFKVKKVGANFSYRSDLNKKFLNIEQLKKIIKSV
jgi:UDP-N-acetylglucosamine 4,6-dehydratase